MGKFFLAVVVFYVLVIASVIAFNNQPYEPIKEFYMPIVAKQCSSAVFYVEVDGLIKPIGTNLQHFNTIEEGDIVRGCIMVGTIFKDKKIDFCK